MAEANVLIARFPRAAMGYSHSAVDEFVRQIGEGLKLLVRNLRAMWMLVVAVRVHDGALVEHGRARREGRGSQAPDAKIQLVVRVEGHLIAGRHGTLGRARRSGLSPGPRRPRASVTPAVVADVRRRSRDLRS